MSTTATTPPAVKPVNPTYVRFAAVNNALAKEPAFAEIMAPATVDVPSRDGTSIKISQAVSKFTEQLCAAGLDPAAGLSKQRLLTEATNYFKLATTLPVATAGTAASQAPSSSKSSAPQPVQLTRTLAIVVLLSSADELAKTGDSEPGADTRRALLKSALDAYRKLHGV